MLGPKTLMPLRENPARPSNNASICLLWSVMVTLVVLAAGAPLRGGVGLEVVGVVAAAAALTVVATVARTRVR